VPATLIVALSLVVPYLPQTEALCGGAVAAMMYRYWGDVHADVQQFAPLVDERAGGIATDVLARAIEERGWQTFRVTGSVELLQEQIDKGRPVMILVADRGIRNHYLLVTGIEEGAVIVHDPTWGPSRRIVFDDLLVAWEPTGFWSLVVLPGENGPPSNAGDGARGERPSPFVDDGHVEQAERQDRAGAGRCDVLMNDAIARATDRPMSEAYEILEGVHAQCPTDATPLREMAGVRFAEGRWRDAEDLAKQAIVLDGKDGYAPQVLASSRFMQSDLPGALRAWNRAGKPAVNLVEISGLERTRFQTVASATGLSPNMLLTASAFRRAERRLQQMPRFAEARLTFAPEADGYVTVNAAVVERGVPRGVSEWAASAAVAAIDREARVTLPGATGQGEMWSASWRWWDTRPRMAFGFAAPGLGRLRGVWSVEASWESQQYHPTFTEARTHGALSYGDWLTGNLRYTMSVGMDNWHGPSFGGRTVFAGGSLEHRWRDDRWTIAGNATVWSEPSGGSVFHTVAARVRFNSTAGADKWVYLADAGVERAADGAPLALWPRAGEDMRERVLLRAHPVLRDGVIDLTGSSVLGRTLLHTQGEVQRWMASAGPARIGAAVFADVGRTLRTAATQPAASTQIDVGAGVRMRTPGIHGVLRVDFARGLRDDAKAVTVGWQF
jgi:peptidase C39-like protein